MPGSYDKIEKAIVKAIDEMVHVDRTSWGNGQWTRELKNCIGIIGEFSGWSVWARDCCYGDSGEWLFDMTWLHYSKTRRLLSVPLVLECEWGDRGNIDDDFQKLLLARASHRIMIFSAKDQQHGGNIAEDLAAQVEAFEGTELGDRYLIVFWCANERKFAYCLHVAAGGDSQ